MNSVMALGKNRNARLFLKGTWDFLCLEWGGNIGECL